MEGSRGGEGSREWGKILGCWTPKPKPAHYKGVESAPVSYQKGFAVIEVGTWIEGKGWSRNSNSVRMRPPPLLLLRRIWERASKAVRLFGIPEFGCREFSLEFTHERILLDGNVDE